MNAEQYYSAVVRAFPPTPPLPAPPPFEGDEDRIRWMNKQWLERGNSVWPPRPVMLLRLGSAAFGVSQAAMVSPSRMPSIVQPRQKTIAFGRIVLNMSLASLGRTFRRDHTTSIYAIQKYRALVERALGLHRARPENSERVVAIRNSTTPGSPG
jgi:hypothetical protein